MHATCGVRSSHVAAGHRAVMTSCARSPAPNCRPVPHRSQRLMRCTVGTGIDPGVVPGPPGVTPGTPGPSISPRQPGGGDPAPGTVPDIDPGTPPSVDPQNVLVVYLTRESVQELTQVSSHQATQTGYKSTTLKAGDHSHTHHASSLLKSLMFVCDISEAVDSEQARSLHNDDPAV